MFFLGASANILVYLLVSAFLGLFLYTQEKPVPADYLVSFISETESSGAIQNSCDRIALYEEIPSEAETVSPEIKVEVQPTFYISPHYRDFIHSEKKLRAPPILVF